MPALACDQDIVNSDESMGLLDESAPRADERHQCHEDAGAALMVISSVESVGSRVQSR